MRPNESSRVMCPDCGKPKLLFETERKAENFIKYNEADIDTGGRGLRAYYCPACCGWHVSSHRHRDEFDTRTADRLSRSTFSKTLAEKAYEKSKRPVKIKYPKIHNPKCI